MQIGKWGRGDRSRKSFSIASPNPQDFCDNLKDKQFRQLFESMNEGFVLYEMIVNSQGKVVDARILSTNPAYERQFGWRREQVIGKRLSELSPIVNSAWLEKYEQIVKTGQPLTIEEYSPLADRWLLANAYTPGPGMVAVVFTNITEHKRMQEELARAREDRFKKCFDNSPDCFAILRAERSAAGQIIDFVHEYINTAGCLETGVSEKDYSGRRLLDLYTGFGTASLFEQYCQVVETGEPLKIDAISYSGMGIASLDGVCGANVIKLDDGIAVTWRNITDKIRLEEELRRRERQYRTLIENIPMVICRYDRDFRHIYVSPAVETDFGVNAEQVMDKTWQEIGINQTLYRSWQREFEKVLRTGQAVAGDVELPDAQGATGYYHVQVLPETDEQGRIETLLTIAQDITKRKQAEEALRQSEERFHKAFHGNGAMMCIVRTANDQIVEVNQRLLDVIGYTRDELVGHTFQKLNLWAEDHKRAESLLGEIRVKGNLQSFEFCLRTKSGKIVTLLASTSLLTLHDELCRIYTAQDITKERRLEAEMQRLDRLNLVGEMAASIGHEVRNPMTTVRGYLQMFQRRAELAKYGEQLTTMIEELDRANAIISEFLSLAKNKAIDRKRGNLNTIIRSLFPLIEADALRMGHEAAVRTGDIPDNEFDPQQVRQLILNLTRNGLEAMQGGGRLTIRTYLSSQAIVLEVQDTGSGIPDEILQQLGTPFVTTKETGTGLGLPVCFRIAERHGAKMGIQSSSQGTTVCVAFSDVLDIDETKRERH
ncbi:hypothetical protein AXX12_06485 [Anaerosporomusa subterranea]|uniref:histidine kinase n=1 Tax=Anaerosporomusa subterranea TaxID=1794912 RepID=A0A154BRE0_ANASB|nr:PAS domain S-box protein [Anaerosporomusa subterranea]KYZ76088.1 hypothetical protein AXX12_06485 [Anaerosporomusa subterranea]